MMDNLTVRFILLWSLVLHAAYSYPRKYPARIQIHPEARKNKLFGFLHSELNQIIPKEREATEYDNENITQLALKIFSKHSNVSFNSEKVHQHRTWFSRNARSKKKSERGPRHILKRRSLRNLITPSPNDHHITNVIIDSHHEQGNLEMDDHLSTDFPSDTQTSANTHNQHSEESELDNNLPMESNTNNPSSTHLPNDYNLETHFRSDQRHGNEEGTEQENDSLEDLIPTTHANSDNSRDQLNGEMPDDEENPFQDDLYQHETSSESSLPDATLNAPFYNGDQIEDTASPYNSEEATNRWETYEPENLSGDMGPNAGFGESQYGYRPENGNSTEGDTVTRTTRNVGHAHDGDIPHTNGQDSSVANGPGNDGIPSTNTENANIQNNNHGDPAHAENGHDDSPSPDVGGDNSSQIIDQHVPSVNHPTDGSKANQTNGNLNSTLSTMATVGTTTNQTAEINATISILTNQTTSTPSHSSHRPLENSTSNRDLATFSPGLHTPTSMSPEVPISEQTQNISFSLTSTSNYSQITSTSTATTPTPLTRFQDLTTTNNPQNVTAATLLAAISSLPANDWRTSTIKQSSPTSQGQTENSTTGVISSQAPGQDNYTTVDDTTGDSFPSTTIDSDEIKTTIKISTEHRLTSTTETGMNITEAAAEPLTSSNGHSSVLPRQSQTTPQIPSENSGNYSTISSAQVPRLTPPHQTSPNVSSSTLTTSSTSSHYLRTSSSPAPDNAQDGSIPSTVTNRSTLLAALTTKSEGISASTTEGEPKTDTTLTATHTVSTSTTTSSSSTSSSTVKDCPSQEPQCCMELHLSMSWSDFCHQEMSILGELVELLQQEGGREEVTVDQVQVLNIKEEECQAVTLESNEQIQVQVYLVNKTHHFDSNLTLVCAQLLSSKFQAGDRSLIQEKLLDVKLCNEFPTSTGANGHSDFEPEDGSNDNLLNDPGVTIAVVIAVVGSCCGVGLITLQTIIRRRHRNGLRMSNNNVHSVVSNNNRSFSITSADSIQLYTVSKSAGGVINLGLNLMEPPDPTHPLNLTQLSEFCADDHKIYHEYQKLPNRLPRLSVVPNGDEDKNRYANVLPLAHTRVKLNKDNTQSSYINANYVTGPNNECQYYIATQAPTTKTINDFWTMVWQQEAKAIVMLTRLEEEGQCKAAAYWPELSGKSAAQRHGDFLIELKQKDVSQEYISSRLEINNLRKIETRQIHHFWYTCWPTPGTPEPISLVKFVLDTRPRFENTGKPLIVHCSPGTGRTGTFIALDLCMRQFELRRIVDVMKTVHDLRLERAGAVQNKEQYALLYNAINEYASIVASPVVSLASSASTLHALLPD